MTLCMSLMINSNYLILCTALDCAFSCLVAGDGHVDWDEFTTFCIYSGLVGGASDCYGVSTLDSYVIEYQEDYDIKDSTLTNHSSILKLRHVPDLRRLMVTQEKEGFTML